MVRSHVGVLFLLAGAAGLVAAEPAVTDLVPSAVARKMGPPYYSGAVLPTPREAEYRDEYVELIDGPAGEWRCRIVHDYGGPARELMERLLQRRVAQYTSQFPDLEGPPAPGAVPVRFVLLSDPAAAPHLERHGLQQRAKTLQPQGYLLEITPQGILCAGLDDAGLANGLASLVQLTHVRGDKLVVRCAGVRDWPTFRIRYTAEYHLPGPDFFDWMMLYKINGFGACYRGMRWEGLTEPKREGLRAIGEYISAYRTMHFMVQFHIGGRGGRAVDCGDPADVERLLQTIGETLELSHAQHVMICYDDVRPELQPEAKKRFERPAQAHGAVMERVYETVKGLDPDTVVSFCTPYYQGRGHRKWSETNPFLNEALQYMEDLRAWKNRDIRIVWTGPVTESRSIAMADIADYQARIGEGRRLVYWDNTWHYHQPLRNFHARYLDGFVEYCADRTSYINVNGVKPIGRFFAATANDYYWNPEAFDPARSRRHAVAQFMGPQAVPAAERSYELRGDDYFVFFSRDVDLEALDRVLSDLGKVSLSRELSDHCRAVYAGIAEKRKATEKTE